MYVCIIEISNTIIQSASGSVFIVYFFLFFFPQQKHLKTARWRTLSGRSRAHA